MARSKKRRGQGRKRKALPRTASGRLSRSAERRTIEQGQSEHETRDSLSELRDRRAQALGLTRDQADRLWPDSTKPGVASESIAGRMALRGALTFVQAEAVDEYARLIRQVSALLGSPAGPRCSLSPPLGLAGDVDIDDYKNTMRCYNDAFGAVRNAGHRACWAINTVVRDLCELPESEHAELRMAADALAGHFGLAEARAA